MPPQPPPRPPHTTPSDPSGGYTPLSFAELNTLTHSDLARIFHGDAPVLQGRARALLDEKHARRSARPPPRPPDMSYIASRPSSSTPPSATQRPTVLVGGPTPHDVARPGKRPRSNGDGNRPIRPPQPPSPPRTADSYAHGTTSARPARGRPSLWHRVIDVIDAECERAVGAGADPSEVEQVSVAFVPIISPRMTTRSSEHESAIAEVRSSIRAQLELLTTHSPSACEAQTRAPVKPPTPSSQKPESTDTSNAASAVGVPVGVAVRAKPRLSCTALSSFGILPNVLLVLISLAYFHFNAGTLSSALTLSSPPSSIRQCLRTALLDSLVCDTSDRGDSSGYVPLHLLGGTSVLMATSVAFCTGHDATSL